MWSCGLSVLLYCCIAVSSEDQKQQRNLLRANVKWYVFIWKAKCHHHVSVPFAFRASGWCGELAEQVRTWEGDIYHPLDYRAVTLPAWKSCGQSAEKKNKSMVIVLHGWHHYVATALVFQFWVAKTLIHHSHVRLIIIIFVFWSCLCHYKCYASMILYNFLHSCTVYFLLHIKISVHRMHHTLSHNINIRLTDIARFLNLWLVKKNDILKRPWRAHVPALYMFACTEFPWQVNSFEISDMRTADTCLLFTIWDFANLPLSF